MSNELKVFDLLNYPTFNRYSVGFDNLFERLGHMDKWANSVNTGTNTYPPYNIEATGENTYVVSLAVAGFKRNEIKITTQDGRLEILGEKKEQEGEGARDASKFIHKGIATRNFQLHFNLADHVEVKSAKFVDGMLNVTLERNVPEALKERVIEIK